MIELTRLLSVVAALLLLVSGVGAAEDPAEAAIDLATVKVKRELRVADADIQMVQAQAAEWPDSSLGCPEKGMQYMPVMTSGYVVKLITATRTHTVHVAGKRAVICEVPSGAARQPLSVRNEQVMNLVTLARDNLRTRVDDPSLPIRLRSMKPTQWPDAGLGCPGPIEEYAQEEIAGFVIELEHDGDQYVYHAGAGRVVLCNEPR